MSLRFDTQPVPDIFFRVGRGINVWQWTDPTFTGNSRWDSPDKTYVVLYASSSTFGAYVESLAHLQPDLETLAEIKKIKTNAPGLRPTTLAASVPRNWRSKHVIAKGSPDRLPGPFIAVGRSQSLATLRNELPIMAQSLGVPDIDAGVLRLDCSPALRLFTQQISQFLYGQRQNSGALYAGIFYLGQRGDEVENYAVFQRSARCLVTEQWHSKIDMDDPDYLRACEVLHLQPS